jgi:hypothetical protein
VRPRREPRRGWRRCTEGPAPRDAAVHARTIATATRSGAGQAACALQVQGSRVDHGARSGTVAEGTRFHPARRPAEAAWSAQSCSGEDRGSGGVAVPMAYHRVRHAVVTLRCRAQYRDLLGCRGTPVPVRQGGRGALPRAARADRRRAGRGGVRSTVIGAACGGKLVVLVAGVGALPCVGRPWRWGAGRDYTCCGWRRAAPQHCTESGWRRPSSRGRKWVVDAAGVT